MKEIKQFFWKVGARLYGTEAATREVLLKKVFSKISQKLQKDTCALQLY